ncbi:alpha/beta hydrolase [Luteimonas sp. SX5]|uniref:Alpha/beta hydrolase n=1 Tax=Luteimonas galliterrae TaxID=2940486 RepID=A0ABT0MGF8_9GAMM|nr:alpha/beta hydrolase [Luteimonas galliterrae]MCL1633954.1 alpha/beta hydrolase [Luteimonas galliterrae]
MKTFLTWVGVVASVPVALAGVGICMAWAPDRPVDTLKARWAPAPSKFIDINGMKAHVRDEGPRDDRLPIVLLHGTSASLHAWDGWVAALKERRRVIRVDMPGFGLTGPTPDGKYNIGIYTDFVARLMDQMGVEQAVVAGNSFGGYVAWKMAIDHPQRVSKLILIDAAGYYYKAQSMPIAFKLAQIPALKPLMANLLPRRMIESSVRNVYGDPSRVTPELIDRYYELTLREGNRAALRGRFAQSKGGEFEAQIKQVKQPTLIIWGGQDKLIPPDTADRFHKDIAGSRLAVFDGLGHVPHEEDPKGTVAAAQAFLAL